MRRFQIEMIFLNECVPFFRADTDAFRLNEFFRDLRPWDRNEVKNLSERVFPLGVGDRRISESSSKRVYEVIESKN